MLEKEECFESKPARTLFDFNCSTNYNSEKVKFKRTSFGLFGKIIQGSNVTNQPIIGEDTGQGDDIRPKEMLSQVRKGLDSK